MNNITLDVKQFIIGDQDENIYPEDGRITKLSDAVKLKEFLESDPENSLQSYTVYAEVDSERVVIRPFRIGKIKNKLIRRICIVLFYFPILAIGLCINIIRGIYFLFIATKFGLTSLYKSGKDCWNKPQTTTGDKNDLDNN